MAGWQAKKFIHAAFRQKKLHTNITRKEDHTGHESEDILLFSMEKKLISQNLKTTFTLKMKSQGIHD